MNKLLVIFLLSLIALLGCSNQSKSNGEDKPIASMTVEDMFPNDEITQALVEAASDGDIEKLDELVAKGADVNAKGVRGYTPLVWVIEHPNKEGLKRLLQLGADPNVQREGSNFSPLQWAVRSSSPLGGGFDLDYLRMMFEIGGGNPNLAGLETGELLIEQALFWGEDHVFMCLINSGAELDYAGSYNASLIFHAAQVTNYKIVLYLLKRGVNYAHAARTKYRVLSLQNSINSALEDGAVFCRDPKMPQYMWFWRVVDFLEQRGMTFDIPPDVKRPAVLDTTPVSFDAEPPRVRPFKSVFIHEVNLTYPTPCWAQGEENAHNIKTRFQQNGGVIMYESIPKNDSPENWTQYQSVVGVYAPDSSFEDFAGKTKVRFFGREPLQPLEQTGDHQLFHAARGEDALEGVLFVGKHKDTFISVYQAWRPAAVGDTEATRTKVIDDMRKIAMEDGYTVTPMTKEMEKQLKQ